MNAADSWLVVDRKGLAKLLERRSPEWIVFELIQNAWDTQAATVEASLTREGRLARLEVRDDDPHGFADLSDAFTLYAASTKQGNPELRGRFNAGHKLVIARCNYAEITSTSGTVRFDARGRHRLRRKSASGSRFVGELRMSVEEFDACVAGVRRLIPPAGITTLFNGQALPTREPLARFAATLPTEIAGADGILRRSARKTTVSVYEPRTDETPSLFELGIPVVETGDRFHVDVAQRVPLNFDRDNVTPGYLAQVRALVLEHMAPRLDSEDVNSTWVRHALQSHGADLPTDVVSRVLDLRFGEKRTSYDPSDPEANARAVAAGYTVVFGSQMSREEWDAARRTGTLLPSGQVTPSPKPFSDDGTPLDIIAPGAQSPAQQSFVDYAQRIASRLVGSPVICRLTEERNWKFSGAYSPGDLIVHWRAVSGAWERGDRVPINDLLLHEVAHHDRGCANHLSEEYYRALSRLGARLTQLALDEPRLFALQEPS